MSISPFGTVQLQPQPGIFAEIINRIIESEIKVSFANQPIQDNLSNTRVIFGISTVICPEIQKWEILYHATRTLPYDQSIVYIILFYSFLKMEKPLLFNAGLKPKTHTKFRIIDELLTSDFLKEPGIRNHILSILQKAQRIYYAFSTLARVYRYKRTPVQINTDLYMNDIVAAKRTTFVLVDHDKLYYFALNDLAKIMLDSLTYSYMFFPEPKVCKNPYNNIPFTKSTLYNMYFQMKSVFCVVPRLIQAFFESDFNVFSFKKRNEPVLREHIIREYVAKTEPIRMRIEILKMIRQYDTDRVLNIHPLFPPESLLSGLKRLYVLYLYRNHTTDDQMCEHYEFELKNGMRTFVKHNPRFGRIVMSATTKYTPLSACIMNSNPLSISAETRATLPRFSEFMVRRNRRSSQSSPVFPTADPRPDFFANPTGLIRYVDTIVYNRDPDMLEDFLENHQYNEAAYNRYVYSGSTAEQDDSDISSHDASSSNNDEYHANEDQDTEAEYVLRIREPSEDETIAADMLAQLQTRMEFGISSIISVEGNPSPVITRSPDHSLSVSPPVFFNIYTESVRSPTAEQSVGLQEGLDNSDEDSTTTDEYVDMRYVIEASDETDELSIATSIDEYADDDGYDSVS
jgi:hypothetical protein